MQTIDKIVIANRSAMDAKYGAAGLAAIQAALQTLVAADKARGIGTVVFYIDDANSDGGGDGTPVVGSTDERGAKAAVDAVFAAHAPDDILLLDGPDVIPHVQLAAIPGQNDGDGNNSQRSALCLGGRLEPTGERLPHGYEGRRPPAGRRGCQRSGSAGPAA